MKFTVDDTKKSFAIALARASDISPRFGGKGLFNPALACVRIEAIKPDIVKIMGTDSYSYVVALARVDVETEGECVVSAHKTSRFIFSKPGELKISAAKVRMTITTPNGSKAVVDRYVGKGGLPATPQIPLGVTRHTIRGEVLKKLMHVRTMANTKMGASGYLTGVLLEITGDKIFSCALNGYCFGISWFPYQTDWSGKFLLHHTSARQIIKLVNNDDDIHLYIDGNKLYVVSEYYYLVCQAVHGVDSFPMEQVKKFLEFEMDMSASFVSYKLVDALNAAKDIAEDVDTSVKRVEVRRMRFKIGEESAIIATSEESQTGYAEYVLGVKKFSGTPKEIVIDSQYTGNLIESLKYLEDSMLIIGDKGITTNIDINVGIKDYWAFFSSEQSNTLYGMAGVKEK